MRHGSVFPARITVFVLKPHCITPAFQQDFRGATPAPFFTASLREREAAGVTAELAQGFPDANEKSANSVVLKQK